MFGAYHGKVTLIAFSHDSNPLMKPIRNRRPLVNQTKNIWIYQPIDFPQGGAPVS
jgi:hypothetical protein